MHDANRYLWVQMPGLVPQGALLAVLAQVRELAELITTWYGVWHAEDVHVGRGNTSSLEHGGHCVQVNVMGGRTKCSVSTDGPTQTQQGQLGPSEQNLQTCCLYGM